jgi:hypothetical protein
LSEGEMKELQKAVPQEGATAGVYKKWLGARIKLIQSVSAREEIKKQFILQNRSEMPTNKQFTMDIGGKKIVVNKGEDANKVISKIGTNVYKHAPVFGGTEDLEETPKIDTVEEVIMYKTPDGKDITFSSQAALDIFKQKTGLK